MALDPNIALSVKPLQVEDPLAQYGKIAAIQNAQNQNALAQYQLGAAQREEAAQNALSSAYKAAYDPTTGEYDLNKLRGAVIEAGAGARLPAVEKAMGELRTQKLTQQELEGKIVNRELDRSREMLAGINPNDPNAPAQFIAWHQANHDNRVLGPLLAARGVTPQQSMARIESAINAGPQAFAQLLNEARLGVEKFAELNKPHFVTQDVGGTIRVLQMPGLGGAAVPVTGSTTAKTLTPEQAREAGLERLIVAKEFTDDAGNVTLINKFGQKINPTEAVGAPAPGAKGAPVTAPTTLKGKSTPEKGRLTEAEGKATGFAMRAQEAHDQLKKLDFSPTVVASKQAIEQTPVLGGLGGALTNVGMSEANQRADQAQREFVNAVMRQESGANITPSEFENARKQYFPQPGDKAGTIEQKRKNRETAIKSLEIAGGKGMEKVKAEAGAGAVTVDLPDGRKVSFPDAKAAAAFKEKAGL